MKRSICLLSLVVLQCWTLCSCMPVSDGELDGDSDYSEDSIAIDAVANAPLPTEELAEEVTEPAATANILPSVATETTPEVIPLVLSASTTKNLQPKIKSTSPTVHRYGIHKSIAFP